eukprot:TRINITY_DN61114_c0_g1_i1.p1 TRINITY_DN61114_c0_g1~~TRINITY_DN61114_c0_g1_i1.p1  ORF type:complete len:127 (-),score=41.89 TRINITY_DN61114_c0_g1_i1:86-466(-)
MRDAQLESIISESTTVIVDANIQSPILVIPLDHTQPETEILALMLGDLLLQTLTQKDAELRASSVGREPYDQYMMQLSEMQFCMHQKMGLETIKALVRDHPKETNAFKTRTTDVPYFQMALSLIHI